MAGLTPREQFEAVAWLRWRVFRNNMRSRRGKTEAVSGIISIVLLLSFGLGPSIGFAFGSYYAISSGYIRFLTLFLWITFFYWQFFPALAIAVSEVFDTSTFLRFPVSLPMYYALWLAFGSLDPALIVPLLWLCGILLGVTLASPALLPWAALILVSYALLNILLSRLITAYTERWMARRKTRELVGALLAFLGIGIQLVSRLIGRYAFTHRNSPLLHRAGIIQRELPPGVAARAIELAHRGHFATALVEWGVLVTYATLFGAVLAIRLRAQYHGENLSETGRRGPIAKPTRAVPVSRGWLALPDPIGAIFEKEVRTLISARQLWIVLFAPPLMLVVFGKIGTGTSGGWGHSPWVLPIGAAYGLFSLAQFFCNSFFGESAGIQLLYLAPVRFRQIMIGKNLAHLSVCAAQFFLLVAAVTFIFAPPRPSVFALTLSAVIFGVFVNLASGDLLSLYFPKKVDLGRVNRQQGSSTTGLIMLGIQLAVITVASPVFLLSRFLDSDWAGVLGFVILALLAFVAYSIVLSKVDSIALRQRETLIAEFTKTS